MCVLLAAAIVGNSKLTTYYCDLGDVKVSSNNRVVSWSCECVDAEIPILL